ncbi:MAG: GGDEF domain-containing protein [Candidatus Dormibacter sp.]
MLTLIMVADLAGPRNVTPGALSLVPVAVAAALLSPRLIVLVVVAGLATRLVAAITGEITAVTAIAEMTSILVLGLVGREAAVNFALAERRALHDPLTGLPNRSLLIDRLGQAIRRAEREKASVCLLYLDLDGFKAVNDRLGHAGGDRLLQLAAEALLGRLRDSDTLARLGGDEFAVLLDGSGGAAQGAGTAERIRAALAEPFLIRGRSVEVRASIGIAVYPEGGGDAGTMMRTADAAMYAAKRPSRPDMTVKPRRR